MADTPSHRFTEPEIAGVYRAIAERRDMRHFRPGLVDPALLKRLLWAAHHAPSVGYMQPWRFIRITDRTLRERMHELVEVERRATAKALGEREDDFMRLKVEGLLEAGEVIVVALADGREKHVFGRRTLPEMDLASVACAIQNMWLAARAEGIGLGWVSIFDPLELAALLGMPEGARPVAILCIGHVEQFYPRPMLEMEHWAERMPIETVLAENVWPEPSAG
jgi:5,6-dimethylbenzimidazole synthase